MIAILNESLLNLVSQKAQESPRKRANHNFHELEDACQRMLNAIEPESYVQPHRHLNPPKDEAFLILKGRGVVILFDEEGSPQQAIELNPQKGCWGVDIPAGVMHTILSLESGTVFYEAKTGPYQPSTDKDFADWAPKEGAPEVPTYQAQLRQWVLDYLK